MYKIWQVITACIIVLTINSCSKKIQPAATPEPASADKPAEVKTLKKQPLITAIPKVITVDDKVAITGGRNIADEYFDYDHEYNFRDRDVLLIGKETKTIQSSFNDFWNNQLSVPITDLVEEPDNNFKDSLRFQRLHQYACNPDNFWPQVRERIQKLPILTLKEQDLLLKRAVLDYFKEN